MQQVKTPKVRKALTPAALDAIETALVSEIAEANAVMHKAVSNPYIEGSVVRSVLARRARMLDALRELAPHQADWVRDYRGHA